VPQARRAHDPRRAEPFYHGGSFWVRADSTRRQMVKRKALWLTPFGEGITVAYERELRSGSRIRWTKGKVAQAERYAEGHPLPWASRAAAIEQMTEDLTREDGVGRVDLDGAVEFLPGFVSGEDLERWHLAVEAAAAAGPSASSSRLYREASSLYSSSEPIEELRSAALFGRNPRTQLDGDFRPRFICDPLTSRMRSPRAGGALSAGKA
jgi:hypothetical protein